MPDSGNNSAGVDLRPLADVIERQGEEIRRLTEAATVWQLRAVQAEERLKQLTAGGDDRGTSGTVAREVGSDTDDLMDNCSQGTTRGEATPPWWRRWLGRMSG